jgi:hypothetical protein
MSRHTQVDPRLKKYLFRQRWYGEKPWTQDCGYDVFVFSSEEVQPKIKAAGKKLRIKAIGADCREDIKGSKPCDVMFNIGKKEPFSADQALKVIKAMKKVKGAKPGVTKATCWYRK